MCGSEEGFVLPQGMRATITEAAGRGGRGDWKMSEVAAVLSGLPEDRAPQVGFIGYGDTRAGDRVLIAVDNHYDRTVVDAMAAALRDKGATVDVMTADSGPDREAGYRDEIDAVIRDVHWTENPRRWEGIPAVEEFAGRAGYDLLL